ncbi:uncharacterized protein LOC144160925 [Haemaphysalis longicornis]
MHLNLQKYPIVVKYTPGKDLFIADALSRFPNASVLKEQDEHFHVNVIANLPISDRRLMQVQEGTAKDPTMLQLHHYASTTWPDNKNDVIPELRSYWAFREELHTQKDIFATHGFLLKLCTDNGPPFTSQQFRDFIGKVGTNHVCSSPYHPRSNGMAETAVQEAKKLLKKNPFGSVDFCTALLEWRNSPRDPCLQSPVQRLMGRLTRSLLPVPAIHLQPRVIPPRDVKQRLQQIRQKQRTFYNRSSKRLLELPRGSNVAVYKIPAKTWYPAEVVQTASTPRSDVVETEDGRQLQRTREHLRPAHQPSAPDIRISGPDNQNKRSGGSCKNNMST